MAGLIIFFRGGGPQGGVYASGAGSACASLALSALVGLSGVSASAASVAISGSMALTGAAGSSSTAAPSLALSATGSSAASGSWAATGAFGLNGASPSSASVGPSAALGLVGASGSTLTEPPQEAPGASGGSGSIASVGLSLAGALTGVSGSVGFGSLSAGLGIAGSAPSAGVLFSAPPGGLTLIGAGSASAIFDTSGSPLTVAFNGVSASSGGIDTSATVLPSADTHDGGTQVVRESHYRKILKLKKKGPVQRQDLIDEEISRLIADKPVVLNAVDDEEAVTAYLTVEAQELDQLTTIAGHLVAHLTRKH
jgi:hypothetical protein